MIGKTTYCEENREIILNIESKQENYIELSDKEKNIKRKYGRSRYKNMSDENKQRLKEYQKNHCNTKKEA